MATKAAKKAGKSLPGPSTSSVNKPVSAADHTKETEINLSEEFQIVGNKMNKRPHSRNDENQVTRDESKRPHVASEREHDFNSVPEDNSNEAQRTVYIKGLSTDLVTQVKRHPKKFLEELNAACNASLDASKIKFCNESLRIVSQTVDQRDKILALKSLGEIPIEVTQPWSLIGSLNPPAPEQTREARSLPTEGHLCVAYKVPPDCPPSEVAAACGADWAKSIPPVEPSTLTEPYTILLSFSSVPPPVITVATFLRLRTHEYIPRPMRCRKCWAFGHTTTRCLGLEGPGLGLEGLGLGLGV
jgi:hypothetical protein